MIFSIHTLTNYASENEDVFDEIVKDAEEALANESEIKSLNFR